MILQIHLSVFLCTITPLMEENPCEAVLVNVAGTRNVADKCIEYDVEKMVMVSTDKAVNPTNVMGCTKRLAEIYVQSMGLAMEQGKKAAQFACWSLFTNPESKTESASPSPYRQTLPRTALTIGRREAVSAGKAVLTPEEENSGRWKNHELGSSGRRGGSRRSEESDTYVNLVEDTESGLIVGGLAFGPEGTSSRWLSQLQKLVGTSLSELIKIGA